MDNTLQRLLDTEIKAEKLVDEAVRERDRMMERSLEEVRLAEARFDARIPEIRASFLDKSEQRIEQTVAEVSLRYEERIKELESMAEEAREDAIKAAIALLLETESA